jgi:hypothetical protein
MILFNNQGLITVKNGGTYESVNELAYEADKSYAFEQVVNIPDQTHSLWVTPEGGDEVLLAEDYAFTVATDTINYRSVKMSFDAEYGGNVGLVEITDFTISDASDDRLSCVLVTTHKPEREIWDAPLIAYLEESYNVTVVPSDSIADGSFTIEDLKQHDFCVVSESCSDYSLAAAPKGFYKTAPIPMFRTDNWSSQSNISGWVTPDGTFGTISDSSGNGGKVIILDDQDHPLSAGFDFGVEIEIVDGTDEDPELGILTYCIPTIVEWIPIAVSSENPFGYVVAGVEAGATFGNDEGTVLGPSDSTTTLNRVASVGLYAQAYPYITEDGYKLLDAGIAWILGIDPTAIEDLVGEVTVSNFELSQNYPNPFNPATTIAFNLAKSGHTTLTVYNLLGQKVATLLDKEMVSGAHQVTFEQKKLASGVYFYHIQSSDFSQIKKMVLMK